MNPYASMFRSLVQAIEAGRRVALCTVVSTQGSTPQTAGAAALVHQDMTIEGTLGGGCIEAEVRKRAFELLGRNQSALLSFDMDGDYGWDDGLICGGMMRVAVATLDNDDQTRPFVTAAEALDRCQAACVPVRVEHEGRKEEYRLHIEAPAKLVIAGAGHVGAAVARLAVGLDFGVVVIDDRSEFANTQRLPPPIRPVVGDIATALRQHEIDTNTFVVIVTRGHKHDEQALRAVIDGPARYIGMIGSRRKVKMVFEDLAALGVDREKLAGVHSPIGVSIGSVTVPEIAVSIVAELVKMRRSQMPTHVEGPIVIAEEEERK